MSLYYVSFFLRRQQSIFSKETTHASLSIFKETAKVEVSAVITEQSVSHEAPVVRAREFNGFTFHLERKQVVLPSFLNRKVTTVNLKPGMFAQAGLFVKYHAACFLFFF